MHVTRRALFRTDIYTQCVVNVKKIRKVNLRLINISNMQPLFDSNRQTFESNIQLLYSNLHLKLSNIIFEQIQLFDSIRKTFNENM